MTDDWVDREHIDAQITAAQYNGMHEAPWDTYAPPVRTWEAGERPPTPGASSSWDTSASPGRQKGRGKGKKGTAPR